MDLFDIYVFALPNGQDKLELETPFFKNLCLTNGFIGINSPSPLVYDIFDFLGKYGVTDIDIVPIKYRIPRVSDKEATEIALKYFLDAHSVRNTKNIFCKNFLKYPRGYSVLLNDTESFSTYVFIDSYDGHVHTRREQITWHQEEYYFEILCDLNLEELEDLFKNIFGNKRSIFVKNFGVKNVFCSEYFYIYIRESKRNIILNNVKIKTKCRISFFIPLYKNNIDDCRLNMLFLIKSIFNYTKLLGEMYANFEDYISVVSVIDNKITINDDFENLYGF